MNLSQSVKKVFYSAEQFAIKRAPELLAAMGVGCFVASTIEAVKVTKESGKELDEVTDSKEKIKKIGKLYFKPMLYGVAGICFVGASVTESNKRYFALTTSYKLIEETARTYKEKVVETIGEKKEKAIRDSIAQDDVDKNPPEEKLIVMTNSGNTLFKESLTGQYFRSDINTVKQKAIALANKELSSYNSYVSVPEWLSEVSDRSIDIPEILNSHGWSLTEQGKAVTIDFHAAIAYKYNDEPCLVITYDPMPVDDNYIYYR